MKVLFINSVYGKGSTGRIVKQLANVVKNNGGEYRIVCGRKCKTNNDQNVFDASNHLEILNHVLLSRIFDTSGFHSRNETKRIIAYIKKFEPDIINIHNLHGYYLNIRMLFEYFKNEFKGKIVWTLHDCWPFTGHCAYYSFANCDKWKNGCYKCQQKKRYPSSYIFDNSKNNFQNKKSIFSNVPNLFLVTPSEWLMNEVKSSFLNQYQCTVINNGIDLSLFKKPSNSQKEKHKLLSVMYGKDERKGYSDLFKLMSILPEDYKLSIVGVNAKPSQTYANSITFVGITNSIDELSKNYSNADIFINPTYEDNFPTVNIEALACGTPVITYDSGGSSEMINKTCGASVPTGNIQDMARAIMDSNFSSEACRQQAMKYDSNERFMEYFNLFKELTK